MSDDKVTIDDLKKMADKFRRDRDWGKHHSSRNLSISIAIEAAELLEKFQWGEYKDKKAESNIDDELADIIIYCLYLASSNKIDISRAVKSKLDKAAKKYPVEVFNKDQDKADDYWRIKKEHRGK